MHSYVQTGFCSPTQYLQPSSQQNATLRLGCLCNADQHYSGTYSNEKTTDFNQTSWFPYVKTSPENPDFLPFDMGVIKPRDVTHVFKNANQKFSPGPDGIPYGILTNLPSTHLILATLFKKIFATGAAPSLWGELS